MSNLIQQFKKIIENKNLKHVLVLIVKSHGSVPQQAGASMLVREDDQVFGTIGGGLLEFKTIEACQKLMGKDETAIVDFDMNEEYSRDAGPICGGSLRMFMNAKLESHLSTIQEIVAFSQKHSSFYIGFQTNSEKTESGGIAFQLEKPEKAEKCIFWQAVSSRVKIYVVGAGHCGLAIAELAHWLGFETHLIDERGLNTEVSLIRFVGRFKDFLKSHPIDDRTAIVLVNKGHKGDAEDLEQCIHAKAGYIGMIGSRRKTSLLKESFLSEKIATTEEWARIYSPIGLDIAAVEVKEIALSVMAEIVAVLNGKSPDKTPVRCLKL